MHCSEESGCLLEHLLIGTAWLLWIPLNPSLLKDKSPTAVLIILERGGTTFRKKRKKNTKGKKKRKNKIKKKKENYLKLL